MSKPTNRQEFKDYCLRAIGAPVIEINVADDQIEDRIDQALLMFMDYHYDGSESVYYKHEITGREYPGAANTILVADGGISYSNTDTITISDGTGAEGTIVTDATGEIQKIELTEGGTGYSNSSTITINTTTGAGADTSLIVGDGSIMMPENIIGAVKVFPIGAMASGSMDMFDIRYQIALNDLYALSSFSLVPYYMTMQHIALIQELLVGQQPIRYNRHMNKLSIDMDWKRSLRQKFLVIEAYQVVDPETYSDVWGDRWLQNYATALIQRQWGRNITKFVNMSLAGGVQFNGAQILADAERDIKEMEEELIYTYSLPVTDFYG